MTGVKKNFLKLTLDKSHFITDRQNSGLIIIPILGAMLISIAAIAAYVVGIEPKYRKKK